ncbi:hypothetical protein Tco_0952198, partial [Tanacetum coccineum]
SHHICNTSTFLGRGVTPPPAPTQPSKLTSPVAINLDPIELLFSTPPSSPQAFLNSLEDLPPVTTNPPSPRPSFDTIERLANEPPPISPIDSSIHSPISDIEPPIPPFPPQCLPNLPSNFPPLPPLGPNNPFPMLTHEMFCKHCQRTQAIVDNLQGEPVLSDNKPVPFQEQHRLANLSAPLMGELTFSREIWTNPFHLFFDKKEEKRPID